MSELLETDHQAIAEKERVAREHLRIIAEGDEAAIAANVTSDYFNYRSADEPGDARKRGPEGFLATLRWLHRAFTDMHFITSPKVKTGNCRI